jgi:hypothetical protein
MTHKLPVSTDTNKTGPEIEKADPSGRVRIAFLGTSTTFWTEVSGDAAVRPQAPKTSAWSAVWRWIGVSCN